MKKVKEETINSHINFLENTLIPDLKESGRNSTAEDFELCLKIMKQQKVKPVYNLLFDFLVENEILFTVQSDTRVIQISLRNLSKLAKFNAKYSAIEIKKGIYKKNFLFSVHEGSAKYIFLK